MQKGCLGDVVPVVPVVKQTEPQASSTSVHNQTVQRVASVPCAWPWEV